MSSKNVPSWHTFSKYVDLVNSRYCLAKEWTAKKCIKGAGLFNLSNDTQVVTRLAITYMQRTLERLNTERVCLYGL